MALQKAESTLHRKIKLALGDSFKAKGWSVRHIDGENDQTDIVQNENKVGDGENKRPDVDAKDGSSDRFIRGEAKIGDGDFGSEHSKTQYKLFSDRENNGVDSWLILGVPIGKKNEMQSILNECLTEKQLGKVAIWEF